MPEGNEIHRYADLQTPLFAGKRLEVAAPNGRFETGALALDGKVMQEIEAYGKHLLYGFGRDCHLHIHLGRYGKFRDGAMPYDEPRGALRLRLATTTHWLELRGPTACEVFSDQQRAGLLARLGPDPLRPDGKPKPALDRIGASRAPIGALLMDQSVIAGIGNIYRAELLFRARLSPFLAGMDVERTALNRIWREARTLLKDGMTDRRIVTTKPSDRPHPTGKARRGEVHYVYRRDGLPCFICSTRILSREFVGRDLYWCPHCQPT